MTDADIIKNFENVEARRKALEVALQALMIRFNKLSKFLADDPGTNIPHF